MGLIQTNIVEKGIEEQSVKDWKERIHRTVKDAAGRLFFQ